MVKKRSFWEIKEKRFRGLYLGNFPSLSLSLAMAVSFQLHQAWSFETPTQRGMHAPQSSPPLKHGSSCLCITLPGSAFTLKDKICAVSSSSCQTRRTFNGFYGRRQSDVRKRCQMIRAVNGKVNFPFFQVSSRKHFAMLFNQMIK